MKAKTMVVAALALALAACAHDMPRQHMTHRKPDWKNPNVHVVDDKYVVVDQEPIVVPKGNKDDITFQLEHKVGYEFHGEGIKIAAPKGVFNCRMQAGGERVVCGNSHPVQDRYKYTIFVRTPSGTVLELDPFIMND